MQHGRNPMKYPISYFTPRTSLYRVSIACALAAVALTVPASSQVITIDTHGNASQGPGSTVDRRFAQIVPTHVQLLKDPLDTKTRLELTRLLQSEQGFAMRP